MNPATRILRICSILLGMVVAASAFIAILIGVKTVNNDRGIDSGSIRLAIGALIIGTPIVLLTNIFANHYGTNRLFPIYVIAWLAMMAIAIVVFRRADSDVSVAMVIVLIAPGLIILPVQWFLLSLGKRIARGWPIGTGRTTAFSAATTYMAYDQMNPQQTTTDLTHRNIGRVIHDGSTPGKDDNWFSEPSATPESSNSSSSDSGSSSSTSSDSSDSGSSSGSDSGGGGGRSSE